MQRLRAERRARADAQLMGADWTRLTNQERTAAVTLAQQEGQHAARTVLGGAALARTDLATLRNSRWARNHGGLVGLDDATFREYVRVQTMVCEHAYIEHVIEPNCPERAAWWWGWEIADRRADPRVCAFCDANERERCQMLGLAQPPTSLADLQLFLWETKEREREAARAWMEMLENSYSTEEYAEL